MAKKKKPKDWRQKKFPRPTAVNTLRAKAKRRLAKEDVSRKKGKKIAKELSPKTTPAQLAEGVYHTKIRVIGIGGGGSSVVCEIASRIKKATFVVANTDLQALKRTGRGVKTFPFGQELTHGLGTGMDSVLGRNASQNESEKIKKLVAGQDLCILIACLGGGVGSGAAPVFAKISRDLGNITYGIFTLPFKFEGEKKMDIAQEALLKSKPYLNALTVIPNEGIFQIVDKTTPLNAALSFINKQLAEGLKGLIETIYEPGLINIDFADLRTIFNGRGRLTYLNTVSISEPSKTEGVIKKVISGPLYPYTIKGAKGVLFNISGKTVALAEVSQISKIIAEAVSKEAKIIFGISRDKKIQEGIKIMLLATGCSRPAAERSGAEVTRYCKPVPSRSCAGPLADVPSAPLEPAVKDRVNIGKGLASQRNGNFGSGTLNLRKPWPRKRSFKKDRKENVLEKRAVEKKVVKKNQKREPVSALKGQSPAQIAPAEPPAPIEEKGLKIRRSAIEAKKAAEEIEREILNQEKQWEIPAFLRKKTTP